MISGHGCDINHGNIFERRIVPHGCVYVTIAECGLLSYEMEKIFVALNNITIHAQMRDPLNNKIALERYFEGALKMYGPGEQYINSRNTFLYDAGSKIISSGLYKVGNPFVKSVYDTAFLRKVNDECIRLTYNGSIYPTVDDMLSLLNPAPDNSITMDELRGRLSLRQQATSQDYLFRYLPGVYYNFACRSLCNPSAITRNIAANERVGSSGMMTDVTYSPGTQLKDGLTPAEQERLSATHLNWLKRRGGFKIKKTKRVKRLNKRHHKRHHKRYTRGKRI